MEYVPQALQTNPTIFPRYNWYAALPVASSINLGVTNSFALSDAIENSNGVTKLNLSGITGAVDNSGFFNFRTTLDLLNFGVKFAKNHFVNLTFQENIDIRVAYNNGLFNLAQFGFADSAVIGNATTITDFGANILHYSKLSTGYTYQFEDGKILSLRPSLYFGKGFVSTLDTRLRFLVDPSVTQFTFDADVIAKTSGTEVLDNILGFDSTASSNFDFGSYVGNLRDMGAGIDIGFSYPVDRTVTLSLAIVDLGFIRWKTTPRTYSIKNLSIDFDGLSIDDLSANSEDSTQQTGLDSLITSIENQIVFNSDKSAFSTLVNAKFFINGIWHLNEIADVSFLIRSQMIYGRMEQAITIANTLKLGKWLNTAVTYTIANNTYNNIGIGFAANAGPIQFYLVSDNILGLTKLDYTKQLNLRLGINIRPKPPTQRAAWSMRGR